MNDYITISDIAKLYALKVLGREHKPYELDLAISMFVTGFDYSQLLNASKTAGLYDLLELSAEKLLEYKKRSIWWQSSLVPSVN